MCTGERTLREPMRRISSDKLVVVTMQSRTIKKAFRKAYFRYAGELSFTASGKRKPQDMGLFQAREGLLLGESLCHLSSKMQDAEKIVY